MEIVFRKSDDGRVVGWSAVRRDRSKVVGSTMAAGKDLPHDLATFVLEDAMGLEDGFWGCVAAGGTFRSLGRKRTAPGAALIRANRTGLDAAERRVNEAYAAWRAGAPGPLSDALDAMLDRWREVPRGGTLDVAWTAGRAPRPTAQRRRR